jgi:hypothetical protein
MILTDNTYSLYLFGHRFEIAGMMKQIFGPFIAALFFFSCTKDNGIEQLSFPSFTANVNGAAVNFMDPVTAQSIKNTNGGFDLKIIGECRINNDSSILISFTIPDFTIAGTVSVDHQLNTNFKGSFIEWKTVPGTTQGKYHFFQEGQLSVQQGVNKYLEGSFHFKYFLFDKLGNKTGEVAVTNGSFSDVIVER